MQPEVQGTFCTKTGLFRGQSIGHVAARLSHCPGPLEGFLAHDPDPLLAFLAEPAAASRENAVSADRAAAVDLVVKGPKSDVNARDQQEAAGAPATIERDRELGQRLDRAERQVERLLLEIAALRSDLATLVSTVDDIRKRQSRPLVPLAGTRSPAGRITRVKATIAAVALVALTTSIWGLLSMGSTGASEPPPIERERAEPVSIAPVVNAAPPPVELQNATSVPPAPPAPTAPPPPARAAPRPVASYVGTLTIDASPDGDVFLNRKNVGRTPLRLEKLRAGSHLIWIEREGYRRWTRVVPVTANRISRVSANLDPLSQ